jgi:ketosteroid isomerase-like protein
MGWRFNEKLLEINYTSNSMEKINQQIITKFYTCFQNKDYKGMQECYADNATFSDEVFVNLNAAQVKAMWEMLCVKGKDLRLDFKNIQTNGKLASAEWIAYYTFSASVRKVVNHVKANFVFENGKIVKHTDIFNFYKWSRQALGITGALLGWTEFFKNKVRKGAMKNLDNFMNKK